MTAMLNEQDDLPLWINRPHPSSRFAGTPGSARLFGISAFSLIVVDVLPDARKPQVSDLTHPAQP
jgi:hypothetical protein